MNPRILLLVAASLALAGCPDKPAEKPAAPAPKVAAPPPPAQPAPATAPAPAAKAACTGPCDMTVNVTKTATACTVDVSSEDVINVSPGAQPTIIKWTLAGAAGFKFAQPNGIAFDKPSGAPPANVMQNGKGGAPVVTVTDKHTGPATRARWAYTIRVTDGSASCEKDPWVDNN